MTYNTYTSITETMSDSKAIAHAVERVCELLGNVTPEDILGKSRVYRIAVARQLAMWYMVRCLGLSTTEAGNAMGKNHTTVMYSARQIDNIIELGRAYDKRVCDAAIKLRGDA